MADQGEQNAARKPRADARRNRALLLETAKAVFAEKGSDVSLDEIARAAGVGIGTLYRHFPTRNALLEAVYQNETLQLAEAARRLAGTLAPVEALREWMLLFVDYIAVKQVMAEAFNAIICDMSDLQAASGLKVKAAISRLADVAAANGDIRLDLEPLDLLRALVGVSQVSSGPGWESSARRLVDILIAGMRT